MEEFNWKEFHKQLDIAIATMIQEENILPSKTSLMAFMKFSHEKSRGKK
jgi:hypothetical protein